MRLHVLLIVTAVSLLAGCERERVVFQGNDGTPPLPPAGLRVEGARDGYIFIGWLKNGESDLAGYIVYRAEGDGVTGYAAVDTTSLNYFIDVMRSYDSTYHYFITAIDRSENESASSDTVSATSPNRYRPASPFSFAVTGHHIGTRRFMRAEWSPVDEADLAGYIVYRSESTITQADPSLVVAVTTSTFFTDSSADALNLRYFYAVTSVDRGGIRSDLTPTDSDVITEKPLPVAPEQLGPAYSYPRFRWLRVPGVTRYLLAVSTEEAGGEIWSDVADIGGDDTLTYAYTGPGLSIGRTYFWRVATITKDDRRPNAVSDARQFYIVP